MAKFNLDTPISELLADEQAKAVLTEIVPGLADNPMVAGLPMSLSKLAAFPQAGFSDEVLQKVEEGLAKID